MSYNATEVIWFRYMLTREPWWGKKSQSYKDSSYAPKSIIKLTTILPFPKDLTLRKSSPLKQKPKLYPGNLDTHLWNNFQSTSFVIGKTFSFICRLTQAANDIEKSASAHPKRIATRPQNEYLRRKIDKKSLWVPIFEEKTFTSDQKQESSFAWGQKLRERRYDNTWGAQMVRCKLCFQIWRAGLLKESLANGEVKQGIDSKWRNVGGKRFEFLLRKIEKKSYCSKLLPQHREQAFENIFLTQLRDRDISKCNKKQLSTVPSKAWSSGIQSRVHWIFEKEGIMEEKVGLKDKKWVRIIGMSIYFQRFICKILLSGL